MKAMLVLVGAAMVCQETNEAEKLFRKMEEKILAAKTVQLKMTGELKQAGLALTGDYLLGESGRIALGLEGKQEAKTLTAKLTSDGKRIRLEESDRGPETFDSTDGVGKAARQCFAAAGFMGTLDTLNRAAKVKDLENRLMTPSGFKLGEKEKVEGREAQIVEYTLTSKTRAGPGTLVTAWIDPATSLPIKREFKNGEMTLVEVYKDLKLDEKVDDAKFELAK
jgi:outer membrane lipoprotein-sorting protein